MSYVGRVASWCVAMVAACVPRVERTFEEGGPGPQAFGIASGTLVYVGKPPECLASPDGLAPRGKAVLLLLEGDTPRRVAIVRGSDLFDAPGDCGGEDAPTLTRSAAFHIAEVDLGRSYRLIAFYDHDDNFFPTFAAASSWTRGDVLGAALSDPNNRLSGYRLLEFGSLEEFPDGQRIENITVALSAEVSTERPVCRIESRPLASETIVPLTTDPLAAESLLWSATETRLVLYSRDASADETALVREALVEGNQDIDFGDPFAYAWHVRPIDRDQDGVPDPHPVLGDLVEWMTPAVILERIRTRTELTANVPRVLMFPSVRPSRVLSRRVFYPTIELAVPPVAVIQTADDAACFFPTFAPGTPAEVLEMRTSDCAELPTGAYSVTVVHGVAGGEPVGGRLAPCDPSAPPGTALDPMVACGSGIACVDRACEDILSETRAGLRGGFDAEQTWLLPNELGDPGQVSTPVPAQATTFWVVDPDPSTTGGRATGREECSQSLSGAGTRPVRYLDFSEHGASAEEVRSRCCNDIRHLCGVPLCPTIETPHGIIATSPSSAQNSIPNCIPFAMPGVCCL